MSRRSNKVYTTDARQLKLRQFTLDYKWTLEDGLLFNEFEVAVAVVLSTGITSRTPCR